jgi:hypothetical protein
MLYQTILDTYDSAAGEKWRAKELLKQEARRMAVLRGLSDDS